MSISKRIVAAVAMAAAGLLGMQAPAHAVGASGGVFVGTLVTPPMWAPVSPFCGSTPCPGAAGSWSLSATGVGAAVYDTAPNTAGPFMSETGNGTINPGLVGTAWCPLYGGSGAAHASYTINGTGRHSSATVHWQQSIASVVVVTGFGPGSISTEIWLVITPTGTPNSCFSGPPNGWTVLGAAVHVHT